MLDRKLVTPHGGGEGGEEKCVIWGCRGGWGTTSSQGSGNYGNVKTRRQTLTEGKTIVFQPLNIKS